jgi:hypothetical protein
MYNLAFQRCKVLHGHRSFRAILCCLCDLIAMLTRTLRRLGGHGHGPKGLPVHDFYPHGVPKRTWPMRDHPKHPAFSPAPGGFWVSKYGLGWPFHSPMELWFWRAPFAFLAFAIFFDITVGIPAEMFLNKEKMPRTSSHYFWGNNGGMPHHFWQYQDGFYIPNHSGVKRIIP